LPARANFIGCFTESKSKNGNIPSFIQPMNIFNTVVNFLNSKAERIMSKKDILRLFSFEMNTAVPVQQVSGSGIG
jgi:hypothetical protein